MLYKSIPTFYYSGWKDCAAQVRASHPNMDRLSLMEPNRLKRRRKKAEQMKIQEAELSSDDDGVPSEENEDDDEESDDDDEIDITGDSGAAGGSGEMA